MADPRSDPSSASEAHIAVLDDDIEITALLSRYLPSHGFRVTSVHTGAALRELMIADPPVVVLLDLGLPGEDGLSIARFLRERFRCGLMIVTGRSDAVDKVVGLEIGADDYVTKPFELRELVARIRALLRRLETPIVEQATPGTEVRFGGWRLDLQARRLIKAGGGDVDLTSGEFDLLSTFARNPGRVLSRDFLLGHTRGRDAGPFDRTIDVLVGRLRRKVEADPDAPRLIKSIRGAGYLFVPPHGD